MTTTDILKIIRSTRTAHGYKQTDMAELLNMNLLAYQRLEQGKTKLDVERMLDIFKILWIEMRLETK